MVNIWNPYQCMVTFNMSRSASYFETGIGRGMGFRDSNQDLLGFVHLVPAPGEGAHPRHRRHPVPGRERLPPVSAADQAWQQRRRIGIQRRSAVVDRGCRRVRQGDRRRHDPRRSRALRQRPERLGQSCSNIYGDRSTTRSAIAARTGCPSSAAPDWNDCLNLNCFSETPGESFQTTENRSGGTAESVFIAGLFVHCAPDYAALAEAVGEPDEADAARRAAETMASVVLEHGWDGDWFLRAYDFFGNKVGSRECEEGQIYIEPQGYCVMAGIGVERRRSHPRPGFGRRDPRLGSRDRAASAGLHALSRRARRDQHVPAGLQGERRDLLSQQPVGGHRRDQGRARRPGIRVLEEDRAQRSGRRSRRSTGWSRTSTRR